MTYTAKIEGTCRNKVYINLLFFKIVRGWRTDAFSWEHSFEEPDIHVELAPIKGVPLAISLDVTPLGADFGISILSEKVPLKHIRFEAGSTTFKWEPVKGVVIEGLASFGAR